MSIYDNAVKRVTVNEEPTDVDYKTPTGFPVLALGQQVTSESRERIETYIMEWVDMCDSRDKQIADLKAQVHQAKAEWHEEKLRAIDLKTRVSELRGALQSILESEHISAGGSIYDGIKKVMDKDNTK